MINGELIDLAAGDYAARIATAGATLVHLRKAGSDLVVPFDAEASLPAAWQGKTLVPWPNRIAGARYTYRGTDYLVPCNEPETGAALHGLVGWADFRVVDTGAGAADPTGDDTPVNPADPAGPAGPASPASAVTLELTLPGSYAYPWSLRIGVRFALDARTGLTVAATTTSLGAGASSALGAVGAPGADGRLAPAPYGVSFHPYLTRSVPLDECILQVPAARVLDVDERLAPAAERDVTGTDWDWRAGRLVRRIATDNAYTGLPQGPWEIRLTGGEAGRTVVMSAQAPWVQVYTAEYLGRRGVAVEPMTCPPDAFNSGRDLVELETGRSHSFAYVLREEE